MNLKDLAKPFPTNKIKWRVGQKSKNKPSATLLAYVDARLVQDRFDEVCGVDGWEVSYDKGPDGGVMATITVVQRNADGCVVAKMSKADGAPKTDIEGVKGGYSDAFKRAAVAWGVFRYGYRLTADWHKIHEGYGSDGDIYCPLDKGKPGHIKRPKDSSLPSWARPTKSGKTVAEVQIEGTSIPHGKPADKTTESVADAVTAEWAGRLQTCKSTQAVVELWADVPPGDRAIVQVRQLFAQRKRELA